MKAVILAGGRGTRLAPVTHGAVPKPMAELLGAPMLEHIVALLKRCGFRDLCCTTACLPEQIERYFGDGSGFGVRMQYRREDRALGTAGAVKNCEDFIAGENALIISGDAACDFDLRALWNEHRRAHAAVTMALYPHEAPLPYGLAVTDGEGWVRSFIEKPAWERVVTDLVNTGIYVLSPEVLRFIPADTPFDFARDLFPRLMASGRGIRGVPMARYRRPRLVLPGQSRRLGGQTAPARAERRRARARAGGILRTGAVRLPGVLRRAAPRAAHARAHRGTHGSGRRPHRRADRADGPRRRAHRALRRPRGALH